MQSLMDVNKISAVQKHRLVKAGIIGSQYSTDENYLRLRYYYHPFAMYCHETIIKEESDNGFITKRGFHHSSDKVLWTKDTTKLIIDISGSRNVLSGGLLPDNTVSTMHTPNEVLGIYFGLSDILFEPVFELSDILLAPIFGLRQINAVISSGIHKKLHPQLDIAKALSVTHPDKDDGVYRAVSLLQTQSETIRNYHKSKFDYNVIDFRRVVSHESFNLLQHLNTHQNNQYLKEFMASDGSYNALVDIYNKSI